MAFKLLARTRENTSTVGTGPIALGGAVSSNNLTFGSQMSEGDTTFACALSNDGAAWEEGFYTLTSGALARTAIIANGAGDTSPVALDGGRVFAIIPHDINLLLVKLFNPSDGDVLAFDTGNIVARSIDEVPTGGSDGQVLTKVSGSPTWADLPAGGSIALDDLTDVVITSPATGQLVKYDGTHFVNGTLNLDGLSDVVVSGPTAGQVIKFDGTNFVNGTVSAGAAALDDLTDVVITSPSSGQVVRYDGTHFVNGTISSVGSLDDLSDVVITSPASGQVVRNNGTNFVNATLSLDDLSDVVITTPTTGQVVKYDGTHFINGTISAGGSIALDDLTDVVITTPASGQLVKYDGTHFINATLSLDGLSDVIIATPTTGQVVKYDGTNFVNGTVSDVQDNVYATWNSGDTDAGLIISGLTLVGGTHTVDSGSRANKNITNGKVFFDVVSTGTGPATGYGVIDAAGALSDGGRTTHCICIQPSNGNIWLNNSHPHSLGAVINKVVRIAIDYTASPPLFWAKNITDNGNWNGTSGADPATGTSGITFTGISVPIYPYGVIAASTIDQVTANFGLNNAFPGTVPSGFVPLGPIQSVGQQIAGIDAHVATWTVTPSSANLAASLTDETGTGVAVFNNGPTLIAPILGTPASGTLTNATGLPVSAGISGLGTGVATFLGSGATADFYSVITSKTGTGAAVFANTPTFTTPNLGVASATTINVNGPFPTVGGTTGYINIASTSGADIAISYLANDAVGVLMLTGKSRGSVGTAGAVHTADVLFELRCCADDGSTNGAIGVQSARIRSTANGTISTSTVPSQWEIATTNAGGFIGNRVVVAPTGGVAIGAGVIATDPGAGNLAVLGTLALGSSSDAVLARAGANMFGIGGATSSFPAIKRSGAIAQIRLADDSDYAAIEASTTRTKVFTVSTLPTVGTAGRRAGVSDANATTYLSIVASGGSNKVPVYDNGTNWVIGG